MANQQQIIPLFKLLFFLPGYFEERFRKLRQKIFKLKKNVVIFRDVFGNANFQGFITVMLEKSFNSFFRWTKP